MRGVNVPSLFGGSVTVKAGIDRWKQQPTKLKRREIDNKLNLCSQINYCPGLDCACLQCTDDRASRNYIAEYGGFNLAIKRLVREFFGLPVTKRKNTYDRPKSK